MGDRRALIAAAISLLATGCNSLPPRGEALVIADTDLRVPDFASRLRVDLYSPDGVWYSSRDIARPDPRDWPVSFGIDSTDDDNDKLVLLRLRVYPDGGVREYRGERYAPRPDLTPPFVPHSIAEMCSQVPKLELGKTITVRRAREKFMKALGKCGYPVVTGTAAAYVEIESAGDYRFAILKTDPAIGVYGASFVHAALSIQSACESAKSAIQCADGTSLQLPFVKLADMTVHLQPGRYYLETAGLLPPLPPAEGAADITVGGALASEWSSLDTSEPEPPPGTPLDLDGAATPATEPEPGLAIDRLALLQIQPGVVGSARLMLRAACLGTMANVGDGGRPSIASATTCIYAENERSPISPEQLDPSLAVPSSQEGSFAPDGSCNPEDSSADVACVPAGMFRFGTPLMNDLRGIPATPERSAVMPRFWIDSNEVTVARWRAAVKKGFVPPPNDAPYPHDKFAPCTWTPAPGAFESYAMSCVDWYAARAFCLFLKGDLPTEAEWEYVSRAAGKDHETEFPWGDDSPECSCDGTDPTCHSAVFGHESAPHITPQCGPGGPDPVDAASGPQGDITPLGAIGLGGGVTEWTLDAYEPYSDACWAAASLQAPACILDDAPRRVRRGGSFNHSDSLTRGGVRDADVPTFPDAAGGFRCVYHDGLP